MIPIQLISLSPPPSLSCFKKAAYHTIRPANLPELLMSSGMDEAHAGAVAQAWEEGATNLVAQLKEHTMVIPLCLTRT
jgi:hypothetical protein